VIVTILGLVCLGLAAFLPGYIDNKLADGIKESTAFTPKAQADGADIFRYWQNNTVEGAPVTWFKIYMMNVTNPAEVLNGSTPHVVEVGPYVYREYKQRFNVTFGSDIDNRKTMRTKSWSYYVFDEEASGEVRESDMITTLNMPTQALYYGALGDQLSEYGVWNAYKDVPMIQRLFTTRNVSELMWGYVDPQMAALHPLSPTKIPERFPGVLGNKSYEEFVKDGKYDIIFTGEDYPELTRYYSEYDHMSYVTCNGELNWGTPRANHVTGSDGLQFKPNLQKGATVYVYVDQMFRTVPMENVNKRVVKYHGIDLYRFTLAEWVLANVSAVPANTAFYPWHYGGLLNITKCANLIPVFLSKPHFLGADTRVSSMVTGLSAANDEAHDTFLDVEPHSGATMHAAKRLQMNVNTKPLIFSTILGKDTWFEKLNPEVIFPLAWFEEGGGLDSKKASEFKGSVYAALNMKYYFYWVGYFLGNVLIGLGVMLLVVSYLKASNDSTYQKSNSVNLRY